MFCEKCGTKLNEGSLFCTFCGNAVSPAETAPVVQIPPVVEQPAPVVQAPPAQEAPPKAKKKKNKTLRTIILVAVLVLLLVVGGCIALFAYNIHTTATNVVEAILASDAEDLAELIQEDVLEEVYYGEDSFVDSYSKQLSNVLRFLDDNIGEEWTISYKVSGIDLKSKKERNYLLSQYEMARDLKLDAPLALDVYLELTLEVDGEKEKGETVIELWYIDGKWCCLYPPYNDIMWDISDIYNYKM